MLHLIRLYRYDRGVSTWSPEGRLFQGTFPSSLQAITRAHPLCDAETVEYAIEAIKLGSTTVGVQTSQGVVLGVEKRTQSVLLESSSIEKIMEIDNHVGCAMSGLVADARTMVDHARVTAQVRLSILLLLCSQLRRRPTHRITNSLTTNLSK